MAVLRAREFRLVLAFNAKKIAALIAVPTTIHPR
jgi:hypothetical protein